MYFRIKNKSPHTQYNLRKVYLENWSLFKDTQSFVIILRLNHNEAWVGINKIITENELKRSEILHCCHLTTNLSSSKFPIFILKFLQCKKQ